MVAFSSCGKPDWAHEDLLSQECSSEVIELEGRLIHEKTSERRSWMMGSPLTGQTLSQLTFRSESRELIIFQKSLEAPPNLYLREFEANCADGGINKFAINNEIQTDLYYSTDFKLAFSYSTRVDFVLQNDEMLFHDEASICVASIEDGPLIDNYENTILMNYRENGRETSAPKLKGFDDLQEVEFLGDKYYTFKTTNLFSNPVSEFYFSDFRGLVAFVYNDELYVMEDQIL